MFSLENKMCWDHLYLTLDICEINTRMEQQRSEAVMFQLHHRSIITHHKQGTMFSEEWVSPQCHMFHVFILVYKEKFQSLHHLVLILSKGCMFHKQHLWTDDVHLLLPDYCLLGNILNSYVGFFLRGRREEGHTHARTHTATLFPILDCLHCCSILVKFNKLIHVFLSKSVGKSFVTKFIHLFKHMDLQCVSFMKQNSWH